MSDEAYNPKAFWYSKINDYRTCPTLYKVKHIDGVKLDSRSLDMEFGTAIHLAVNDILLGNEGVELFDLYWDSIKNEDLPKSRFDWKCLQYNAHKLLPRFARLHAKHFLPHAMEERIFTEFKGHLVEGTPDFLGDYKNIPSIVDFKTAGARYDEKKIIAEDQLSSYAAMAIKKLGYTPKQRVYVVFIKHYTDPSIQILKSPLTDDAILCITNNMTDTIEEIKSRTVFTRNVSNCVRGNMICPNFAGCWGTEGNESE